MNNVLIDNISGVDAGFLHVCEAVSKTLGAEGKLAILEHPDPTMPPTITKDGVSVANHIRFSNKENNFGAFLARQVAAKTLQMSGDSTSTSLVFSKSFLQNFKERGKYNKAVERGIHIGYLEALDKIKQFAKPVDNKTLERIAVISANNDEELGKLIISAYDAVGTSGIVEVRKAQNTSNTTLDIASGMKIEKGYHSPFFINNNQSANWEGQDVLVAVLETWVSDETIKQFIQDNRYNKHGELQPMLLVMEKCEDINFVMDLENFGQKKLFNICMITTPDVEKFKKITHLQDIALYSGAEVYRPEGNIVAGHANTVVVTKETTTIINKNVSEGVKTLIEELKKVETEDDFTKKRVQRLEGISCTINVGGYTDSEIDEKFDRVDDSLKSVKSSIEEGWISGGGSALVYISGGMIKGFTNPDEQIGYELVKTVLQEPFKQIIKNANRAEKIEEFFKGAIKSYGIGYNAKTDEISDLILDGVIDSAKSIRVALDNAKSVAVKILNVGVVVTFTN